MIPPTQAILTVTGLSLEATAVFASFAQPVSIFASDGTYLYVNPAGLSLIGKSYGDVVGKKYLELYPDLSAHPYHQAFSASHQASYQRRRWSFITSR